jgi:hypothetical protein
VGLVLGGTGVAALAGGVVAAVVAANKQAEVRDGCARANVCSVDMMDEVDSMRTARDASAFLLVGGGLSLASGVVVYLLAPNAPKAATAFSVSPAVAPGAAGLFAAGRF